MSSRVVSMRTLAVGRSLAVCQVVPAFVLLALFASVLHELYRLLQAPLGFSTKHVVTFTVDKGWNGDRAKVHQFYAQVAKRLRAQPGVKAAGAMTALPRNPFQVRLTVDVAGRPLTRKHDTGSAEARGVMRDFFPLCTSSYWRAAPFPT